ncbi:hypothetical protein [Streptomyces radicis]|uniref:Uncharacterized protein n=1 Tax=Streptomyces radicis TaxID=1750517 RepID=A0A3A9VW24_9ACTN|nr:hypothetical protein [Streptomyces radicis]RKN05205.1 hypothetical protein D7319_25880 [Streptomyces radicis]RKN16738.1 hypothetical protein D7318_25245 [Streptomyces radicis]
MGDIDFRGLGQDAALLIERLGTHPTPDFHRDFVERMGGAGDPDRARRAIETLVAAGLLTPGGADRYHMEPSVHRDADRRSRVTRGGRLSGVAGWYLRRMAAVDLATVERPRWGRIFATADVRDQLFPGAEQALTAMDPDRANIAPLMRTLFAEGEYGRAYQLGETLHGYYRARGRHDEWIVCLGLALAAAVSQDSRVAAARMHLELAAAHRARGWFDDLTAMTHLRRAHHLATTADPPHRPTADQAREALATLTEPGSRRGVR